MLTGGCHCGAIRYEVEGEPAHAALCHCTDCRLSTGAPVVAWTLFGNDGFRVTRGAATSYASSEHARRHFCGACGTSLFYTNEAMFPDMTDVCAATLDTPDAMPVQIQIQTADRIGWMETAHELPQFERYPSGE
jgi:hypothetical protein